MIDGKYPMPPLKRLALAGLMLAGLLMAAPIAPAVAAFKAPDSVADLTEGLLPSVVFVQTSQVTKSSRQAQLPQGVTPKAPDGSPFQDFFDDFFKKQQKPDQPPPSRVQSVGSGFVIDASGIIVTNNHVIDGADQIDVSFSDGTKLRAELVGRDTKVDLAVLKVKPTKPLVPLKFGDSDKSRIGDWVLAIGNPFGLGETVTLGIISAKNRDIHAGPYDNYLQTDAAINRGNSGGPLFNMAGEVVGINTAIISPSGTSAGIGFAIPANTAMPVIEQLRQFGETRRGWLGVKIQDLTSDIADSLGLKDTKGVLVADVTPKGPAEAGGMKAGDVIVSFDKRDVPNTHDLTRMVADSAISKEVEVGVLRKGKTETLKITLGRLEDGEKLANAKDPATAPPPPTVAVTKLLGLGLTTLDPASRTKFKLTDKVAKGVVIADVEANSRASDKHLVPGDVILEVGQEEVGKPDDVVKRIEALKAQGRTRALLMVQNGDGAIRFEPLPID